MTFVPMGYKLRVYVFNGSDVQAAGGLNCNQKLGIPYDFTSDNKLLLVASGKLSSKRVNAFTAAYIKLIDHLLGVLMQVFCIEQAVLTEGSVVVLFDGNIIEQRGGHDQSALLPVLGNMPDTDLIALSDICIGDIVAVQGNGSPLNGPQSGDCFDQFSLAVAVNTGDAYNLAGFHREGEVLYSK